VSHVAPLVLALPASAERLQRHHGALQPVAVRRAGQFPGFDRGEQCPHPVSDLADGAVAEWADHSVVVLAILCQ